ncbi:peptidoglycan recognition family protein [Arcanobacterium hippocoleae]
MERTPQGAPNHITIHHWGDPAAGATFQGVINYLCRENGSTSAHYVAEAGRVACIVDPDNRAWHARDLSNPRGIGIECNPAVVSKTAKP